MTSYGDHLTCKDIKSTGTIHWHAFDPPIQGGGVDTLAGVLAAGNDANFQQIRNVAGLSINKDPNNVTAAIDGHITGAEEVDCNTLRATESFVLNANCITLDFDENAGNTTISGSTVAGQETVCTNLDLRDPSNLFPSSIDDDTLGDVMTRGNQASTTLLMNANPINMGGANITNVHNFDFAETEGQTHIYGDITVGRPTVCFNLDLRDPSNLMGGSVDTLGTVMTRGNQASTVLDMDGNDVENVVKLEFDPTAATSIVGNPTPGQPTVCTNLDLTHASNTFPLDTLEVVLNRGNDANGNDIDMSGGRVVQVHDLDFAETEGQTHIYGDVTEGRPTQCFNLDLTDASNTFPSGINGDLAATLLLGNSAGSTDIDMNGQSIVNALVVDASNLGVGSAQNPGVASINGTLNANLLQGRRIYMNSTTLDPTAFIEFTGLAGSGQTTEIIGDSSQTDAQANLTKCTFLDLTDGSNKITFPSQERYEWSSVWTNAQTIFPPPPYKNGGSQIPTINQVLFDFNTIDCDRTPGWRYFAPQSDSDCQIDPDDNMGLHEGEYVHTPSSIDAWKYAFYGVTAATTIEAHKSQIVEFTFPVTYHGYGRIYMALAYQPVGSNSPPLVLNQTFRLVMEHEGSALSNNERLNGPTTMKWYIKDEMPTNGTRWKLYPLVRVDDNRHMGRMQVVIGNGQPLDGCNPGDPPDFEDTPPAGQDAQNGQLFIRGYPLPVEFNEFANPSESIPRYFDPNEGKEEEEEEEKGDPSW